MASLPSSHYDGNADDPSWLLLHGSPVSSDLDSGSFKSLKSSADFLHNPLILEFNGGTDSFTVSRFPKSSRKRKYGSDSITHGATLGLNSSPNQYSLFVPQVEVRQHPPPKPTLSESSFYSFNSAPDNSKSRANLFMDHTNLLDRPPTTTMPFDSIFEPTVDKSLLEPQHPPTLDGYVQMDSTSNLTTLPGSNSTQKLEIPNPGDHLLDHSPSTRTPTSQAHRNVPNSPRHSLGSASQSGSDCFMTAPTSLESNSSDSFETAPTSIPANKSSVNILEPQLHPTNGNIDKRKPPALKLPNWTLVNNLPPNLFRHRWTIFANHKASAFNRPESQRSVESLFLPHPRAKKPPPRKDPVHDGSFLTPAIHTAVNEAFTLFEAAQQSRALSRPRTSSNPFSLYSPEALTCQYATAIDAKNALVLRQSAILADIGLFLELLIPKINTYVTDRVKLINVHQDLDYIHKECANRQIDMQFGDLEWRRSDDHPCGLAFTNKNRHTDFSWKERIIHIGEHHDAQAVGQQFLNDPAALIDNRFPPIRSQR